MTSFFVLLSLIDTINLKIILSKERYNEIYNIIPKFLFNNSSYKTDVLFFLDRSSVYINNLDFLNDNYTIIIKNDKTIIYSILKDNIKKSKLHKIIGTKIYKLVTIRNLNTTTKIYELLNS